MLPDWSPLLGSRARPLELFVGVGTDQYSGRGIRTPLRVVPQRGGVRAVYFRRAEPDAIYLLTAYAKADREDLSPADRKVLSRLVSEIKKEEKDR